MNPIRLPCVCTSREPEAELSLENWTVTLCNLVLSRNKIGKELAAKCLDKIRDINANTASREINADAAPRDINADTNAGSVSIPNENIETIMEEGEEGVGGPLGARGVAAGGTNERDGIDSVLIVLTHTWHIISVVTQG